MLGRFSHVSKTRISRRKMIGGLLAGAGTVLTSLSLRSLGQAASEKGRILMGKGSSSPGIEFALRFPLMEALQGRRARRFSLGASIPDGPLAFTSKQAPMPLSDTEQMMVLTAVAGNTGWLNLHPFNKKYLPSIPNYAAAAGGRTFPSSAGFHTSEIFFTDDTGVYFMSTRDMLPEPGQTGTSSIDLDTYFAAHRKRIRKLADGRMAIPENPAHIEMHNPWCVNRPGSTLIMPVADISQHSLLALCYIVQNGACIYDDINKRPIPGLEKFSSLVSLNSAYPLSFFEQYILTEATVEIGTACYAGMLALQSMGLGGWMFDGLTPFSVLGASGDPAMPGLGFSFSTDPRWPVPNATGLPGVFEGYCPPHYPDMRAATEAIVRRKFGSGGPFNADTPGPYRENARVRGAGKRHDPQFVDCVVTMAQYIYDTFGRFPATVPTMQVLMYLQAHHLDLEFYDTHFGDGAYLETHRRHMELWHS